MNYYSNYGPMYGQQMQQPVQRVQPVTPQPMEQQYPQFVQPQPAFKQSFGLLGKSVDNIEVVKAMDIPLDGSISYFPIVDGTAIVTKQLQQDGTSKIIVYQPVQNEEKEKETAAYVTIDELNEAINNVNNLKDIKDLKEEMKTLKRQVREISFDLKDKKGE